MSSKKTLICYYQNLQTYLNESLKDNIFRIVVNLCQYFLLSTSHLNNFVLLDKPYIQSIHLIYLIFHLILILFLLYFLILKKKKEINLTIIIVQIFIYACMYQCFFLLLQKGIETIDYFVSQLNLFPLYHPQKSLVFLYAKFSILFCENLCMCFLSGIFPY
jgi:hypothetical protein